MELLPGQKGKNQLVTSGFCFVKDKQRNDKIYWVCEEYRRKRNGIKGKCPATAQTNSITNEVFPSPDPIKNHNHLPDLARVESKKILSEIKNKAKTTTVNPKVIVEDISHDLSPAIQGVLPLPEQMMRIAQRSRQREHYPIGNPRSLEELVIPQNYQVTRSEGEDVQFLLYDSGEESGPDRLLLFSTAKNLRFLQDCHHWFCDGTFKVTPPLYQARGQLFTIHGLRQNRCLPLVYGLLPSKEEATYRNVFQKMIEIHPGLEPQTVTFDFEQALYNVVSEKFPNARMHGCLFHFGQCIWRHIQQFPQLSSQYKADVDFQRKSKYLMALAFVPVEKVITVYNQMIEWPFFNNNDFTPLLDYFEKTWLGALDRRGRRRPPRFPMELWNCYQSTLNGEARTNNHIEGWHRGFASAMGSSHPTIWKFIDSVKKEQSLTELKIEQLNAGRDGPLGRRVYRDLSIRLLSIVRTFEQKENNIEDYLRGISHCLSFGV